MYLDLVNLIYFCSAYLFQLNRNPFSFTYTTSQKTDSKVTMNIEAWLEKCDRNNTFLSELFTKSILVLGFITKTIAVAQ